MHLNYITPTKSNQWLKIITSLGLFLLLLFLSILVIFCILKNKQEKSGLYYINANYNGWLKLGSEKYPYQNISKAFQIISEKKIISPVIHLKNGEYDAEFEIPENTKVYGESQENVVLKNTFSSHQTIIMKNNSLLSNLTVIGNTVGILVENQTTITNCVITKSKKIGIKATALESELLVENCSIFNSDGKGLYLQKGRKVKIIGNDIYNNREEGIDIREVVSGEISGNKIYNNGESGIELVVGGSNLDIKENNIWDNEASGITCQYYAEAPELGKIFIHANHIKAINSEKYTVSVKSPSGGKGRPENYWRNSIKILDDNIFDGEIRERSLEITKKEI